MWSVPAADVKRNVNGNLIIQKSRVHNIIRIGAHIYYNIQ